MMNIHLKQFVPSGVCLKCDGCCRFQSADSLWRPKWDKREFVDDQDYVTTIVDCGKHLCRFLNKADSTCRVYSDRPFECALYPFLLSRTAKGVSLYVHLACPYVQDMQTSKELQEYMLYLQDFFAMPATLNFLKHNTHLIHDYSLHEEEMKYVLTIQAPL